MCSVRYKAAPRAVLLWYNKSNAQVAAKGVSGCQSRSQQVECIRNDASLPYVMHTRKRGSRIGRASFCYNKNMARIIDTTDPNYIAYCKIHHQNNKGYFNGAYYYSQEIVKNIIPNVKTDRPWDTLGMRFLHTNDHAIVFLHHNISHERVYRWLRRYKDLVLVCSTPLTYKWAQTVVGAHAVFLPLSVDVDYVKQFKTEKTKDTCYMGNRWSFKKKYEDKLPPNVDFPPSNIPREDLLKWIAPYRKVYAIGRCAIEARVLGAEILPFYDPFPEPNYWKVVSNQEAAQMLQKSLDQIDGPLGN